MTSHTFPSTLPSLFPLSTLMASSYVELSMEDSAFDLVRHICNVRRKKDPEDDTTEFYNKCVGLSSEGKIAALLSLFLAETEVLFYEQEADGDVEGCYNVIVYLLRRLPKEDVEQYVKQTCDLLTLDTIHRTQLRIKIMANIFNVLDTPLRYDFYRSIVVYATKTNNVDMISGQFGQVEEWLHQWGVSVEAKRQLLLDVAHALAGSELILEGYKFLKMFLKTWDGVDPSTLVQATERAATTAIEAIRIPNVYQYEDLLGMDAVKQLEKDTTHGRLFELLRIFSIGRLEDYLSFYKRDPAFIGSLGLDHEKCMNKMRLLSLVSLGAEHREIPYATIANTLAVDEDDIETWVIGCISANLIEAKMNEYKRVVTVSRCLQREFGTAEWAQLSRQLASWRTNLASILDGLGTAIDNIGKNR